MGADLLVAYVAIDKKKKPSWKAGISRIDQLADTPMLDLPGVAIGPAGEDLQGGDGWATKADRIATLRKNLEDLRRCWKSGFRDMVLLEICHKTVLLSGGMSWGDAPTENYEMLSNLIVAGITKACGFDE